MSALGLQVVQGQGLVGLHQALAFYTPEQIFAALRAGGIDINLITQNAPGNAPQGALNNQVTATINTQIAQRRNRGRKPINRNKPRIIIPPPARPTRPLNSFIAYRSYYAAIFVSLQQKEISGFLTYLWQSDPFKAKWTILAKAYSVIRDQLGRHGAPLDKFLIINAPFVGIIPPDSYLALLGWEIKMNETSEFTLTRRFTPDLASFDKDILGTNESVHDIIQNSYEKGYIPQDGGAFWLYVPAREAQNIMAANAAANAQPPFATTLNPDSALNTPAPAPNVNPVQAVANQNIAPAVGQNASAVQPSVVAGNSTVPGHNANFIQATVTANDSTMTAGPDSTVAQPNVSVGNSAATEPNINPTQPMGIANESTEATNTVGENADGELTELEREMLARIMAELDEIDRKEKERKKQIEDARKSDPGHDIPRQFAEAGIQFPFYGHFNPQGPNITLNPYEGEKFDQYDINDMVHSEMFE